MVVLRNASKFAPTFVVGTVYVDLRELAGRMVGRIMNINKKGQLSYVTVVSSGKKGVSYVTVV